MKVIEYVFPAVDLYPVALGRIEHQEVDRALIAAVLKAPITGRARGTHCYVQCLIGVEGALCLSALPVNGAAVVAP